MTLSADALLEKARRSSGIDIDDVEAREPLQIVVDSLNRESRLSLRGLGAMEDRLLRLLDNRLRMARDLLGHPEILDQKIIAPVFVFGLPRSGTTKLQKLLCSTGDYTALPLWKAHNPSLLTGDRNERPDTRIQDTEEYVRWIDRHSPGIRSVHRFDAHEPEEVNPILEHNFRSAYLPAFVQIPSYIEWFATQPPQLSLQYLKRVLQYLQWQFGIDDAKPWVLKNPTFLGLEPVLKEVFPDATLLVTHRRPAEIISSAASLIVNFHKLYSDADVTNAAGIMMLEGQAYAIDRHLKNRASPAAPDIIDIGYGELTTASMGAVDKIYRRIGQPLSEQARSNMARWECNNQQHKFGAHRYALADFALSNALIDRQFGEYLQQFDAYF